MTGAIQRSNNVVAAPLDDTLLMMSIEAGRYHSLNAVGARIWELLEQPTTQQALVAALIAEFEVTPDDCTREVGAFLSALRERGLLTDIE